MKLIITESQKEDMVKSYIRENGLKESLKFFDVSYLADKVFDHNPNKFLEVYSDLEIVKSSEEPWFLFRYKEGKNIMVYNHDSKKLFVNFEELWGAFGKLFGLDNNYFIESLILRWVKHTYNIKPITCKFFSIYSINRRMYSLT